MLANDYIKIRFNHKFLKHLVILPKASMFVGIKYAKSFEQSIYFYI